MRTLRNVILVGLLLCCWAAYREYQGKPTPVKDWTEMRIDESQAEPKRGLFEKEKGLFKKEQGLFKREGGLFTKKSRHEKHSFPF